MHLEYRHIRSPQQLELMQKYTPGQFIQQASSNIQKLTAELRHHVLASEDHKATIDDDRRPTSNFGKFIDLKLGTPLDIELIGDDKIIKEDTLNIKSVPLLLRVKDCKRDDTFVVTIKQVSKEQLSMISRGSKQP